MLLRLFAILLMCGIIAANKLAGDIKASELQTIPSVDLARYAGRWYEIARLPNSFQKKCAGGVTATYELRPDGKVAVINECRKASAGITRAKGTAEIADKKSNAKLKVTFFWPFYGDYWILDLGPNYEYAVVGEPKRRYLWILSRTPQIDDALYQELLARMANQGFDTSRVVKTLQP